MIHTKLYYRRCRLLPKPPRSRAYFERDGRWVSLGVIKCIAFTTEDGVIFNFGRKYHL